MVLDLDAINESLREVFTEESAELIDDLEARLLSLEEDGEDIEQIHAAFRAAHSIKGGAGALSYELMVELTHLAEAILEEYRTEKSSPNAESIALLLDSVDWLRRMMDSGNPSTFPREPELEELMESLKGHIGKHDAEKSDVEAAAKDSGDDSREHDAAQSDGAPDGTTSSDAAPSDATLSEGYSISFRPHADIMKGGNDPLRILRELHEMGTLTGSCTESELPDLLDLDPATIHIAWDLHLSTEATEEEIEDVFSWVEDECELEISAQAPSAETEENQPAQAVAETEGPSEAAANAPPEPDPAASSSSSGEDAQSEAPAKDAARKKSAKSEQAPSRRPKAVVRVSTDKIDALINMVGELVITQSILGEIDDD
ncbi:MAG: Hpt domain-containing protein, partial [Myxococcota bacterium]